MSSFTNKEMTVIKRDGTNETVEFDKILNRVRRIGEETGVKINYTSLVVKVIDQLCDNISTSKIDELLAEQCISLSSSHTDYSILAGQLLVSNHQKNTSDSFSKKMTQLYEFRDIHGKHCPKISNELYELVSLHGDILDSICDYSRDFLIDYFGFKTLERAYLFKLDGKIIERPQDMWLRVACGIHCTNSNISEYNTCIDKSYADKSYADKSCVDGFGAWSCDDKSYADESYPHIHTQQPMFEKLMVAERRTVVQVCSIESILDKIRETYDGMSQKYFTHATPTLFNAGTPKPQLSSCFLLAMESDSINGIYDTLKDCAIISKHSGGIGLHIHNIRASGSHIRGTNGQSNGIVPMLKVFNNTAKYVDQCVVPETIIYTKTGPTEIQNCCVGETEIYNLHGETEVIQNILEHTYEGELLHIKTQHSFFPLQITAEHPVYCLRNGVANTCNNFEWVDAGELTKNDMIVYPMPTYSKDIDTITEDDCYMYGILLGDNNKENNICIKNKPKMVAFITNYFDTNLVQYTIHSDHIQWKKSIHLPFRHNDIYNTAQNKRIHHKWLHLPIEKSAHIIRGLVDTEDMCIHSKSSELIECVRFLCMKLGTLTTSEVEDDLFFRVRIIPTPFICKLLDISDRDCLSDKNRIDHFLLSPVQEITKTHYSGVLYDLQLEKEHNYLLHNGLVHNGGGKRNGSFAIYLEPWHADIESYLQLRMNHGDENLKARDLFYGLWIPDLFMERVKSGGQWTLMCPDECPGLADVYGEEFVTLYTTYERNGRGRKTILARDLWYQILDAQMETGMPYLLYKDACNSKSNQKNLGTIKSSNLCCEVVQYSDENETAVCNLASIALPSFVVNKTFDFVKLQQITELITYNLNRVIDINYYPTEKCRNSNQRHRPIGIGIQGLADVFMILGISFESEEAKTLNRDIFETMYYSAVKESCRLAQKDGPYSTFANSPASKGILQFDMWNVSQDNTRHDWTTLKQNIITHGLRNSLLMAPMPTASTSQILGFNECIEPITNNIYSRRTNAGEFLLTNKYLMKDLLEMGIWNETVKNQIVANGGSIQTIESIPMELRVKYKTVWEIPAKVLIDMAADRGPFICQSQSSNYWMAKPDRSKLTKMHMYAWSKGLKTGIYYLRQQGAHQAQKFTIEPTKMTGHTQYEEEEEEETTCETCSA